MKNLLLVAGRTSAISTLFSLITVATLGLVFWFSTTALAAPPGNCTVCHMRRNTLTLPCQGNAIQAHLGHESIQTTIAAYTHLDRRSMAAAADVMAQALDR